MSKTLPWSLKGVAWMGSCGVGPWKGRRTDRNGGAHAAFCSMSCCPDGGWAGTAACSTAQPRPLPVQPLVCAEGQGRTRAPRYGQVPGSCSRCPGVLESAEASLPASPDPVRALAMRLHFGAGSSGWEQARKPRGLLPGPPGHRCREDRGCGGHAATEPPALRPPRQQWVPLPLPAGVIDTVSCPGKFRSLTLPGWFPLSCPAPIGSSHRPEPHHAGSGRAAACPCQRVGWRCWPGPGKDV